MATLTPADLTLDRDALKWRNNGTKKFVRYYGASGPNTRVSTILRMRKHYWGGGVIHLRVHKTYYTSYENGEFVAYGHTRPGHSPFQSLATLQSHNGPYVPYWDTAVYPSGTDEGYCDLKISVTHYEKVFVEIFCTGFDNANSEADGATSDMYALPNSSNSVFVFPGE